MRCITDSLKANNTVSAVPEIEAWMGPTYSIQNDSYSIITTKPTIIISNHVHETKMVSSLYILTKIWKFHMQLFIEWYDNHLIWMAIYLNKLNALHVAP